jgi:hypothetical protein
MPVDSFGSLLLSCNPIFNPFNCGVDMANLRFNIALQKPYNMKKLFFLLSMIAALSAVGCKKNNTDSLPANSPNAPQTEVPGEMVGAWENGSIDFVLWENYREGYYAGRNATPSREAMIFYKNGEAKFYRYEFAYGVYEELIDCTEP